MKINLRTYVALIFAFMIFSLSTILSIMIGKQSSETIREEIGHTLSTTAYQMADNLDFFMWSRIGEIDILSQLEDINHPNKFQNTEILLNQLQTSFPAFSWVGLTDLNGKVLVATNGILKGADISKRPVFQEGIKGQFIGDVHDALLLSKVLPNPGGEPLKFVDISKAIVNENGQLTGVLAAHLSWNWANQVQEDILKSIKKELDKAEIVVVSKKDNMIILGPKELIGTSLNLDSVNYAQKGQNNWLVETWPNGKDYLTGYAYGNGYQNYSGLGWSVLVRIPEEIAYAPVKELQKSVLLIGVISSFIFAIIGWFIAGPITKPLQQISNTANRLRAGERVEIPYYNRIKDLEVLSLSLRELVDSLVRTTSDLSKMENLANHDRLTGLPNRIALDSYLEATSERTKQIDKTLTFLYLDLDGFKHVNDTHGHHIGDLLLQNVSNRLINCIHVEDRIFRLGGDEFLVVLLTSISHSTEEGTNIAEKIITTLKEPFYIMGYSIEIGCSVGGAVWDKANKDLIGTISLADEALYESKRTGKNKVTFKERG